MKYQHTHQLKSTHRDILVSSVSTCECSRTRMEMSTRGQSCRELKYLDWTYHGTMVHCFLCILLLAGFLWGFVAAVSSRVLEVILVNTLTRQCSSSPTAENVIQLSYPQKSVLRLVVNTIDRFLNRVSKRSNTDICAHTHTNAYTDKYIL